MRRYWEIDQTFAQPSESLLKKNLKESVKSKKKREISWSRLLFPAGQLQKLVGKSLV